MEKYSQSQIDDVLTSLTEWSLQDEKWIVRKFRFQAYMDGIQFVNQVADLAERMNHHPMIAIDFKMVSIRLTSWKSAGITDLDIEQARGIDKLFTKNTIQS